MSCLLELKSLCMVFGGLTAVSFLDLNIQKDSLIGIIGPNGAGKTTVFNMITQHYKPTSGQVIFKGKTLNGLRPDEVVKLGIARTFQNIRLFSTLSVQDNVLAAMHLRLNSSFVEALLNTSSYCAKEQAMQKRTNELLEMVGLEKFRMTLAGSLPYGLQRRLEIARALATEPTLLLLDEPAAGMNPQEVVDLIGFIRDIKEKFHLTVLIIEHHMNLVMNLCDRMVVLNYGTEIAEGTASEIQNNPKVIEAYLGVNDNV